MRDLFKKSTFAALIFILAVSCLIFFKIAARGFYPIPADLLVSFYFPWYSGGWEGYNSWTTHKELLGADSIRQIYPWKEFAMRQFKEGNVPLWNPYTFSGQPLLANFQSSVFYPLNIFYFLTDPRNAWILLIISQPFLAGIFMYLALRSFSIIPVASIFGAIAFMFSSYLITWMENGNIAHGYIWFPLAIYVINKYFEVMKFRYLLILIFSLAFSILAGHPQTAIYLYLTVSIYWLFKAIMNKNLIHWMSVSLFVLTASFLLSGVQLIPTYDFYKNSPISLPFSREVFDRSILPFKNLVSFFASDFYGHPANNNFWSQSYGDFTPYFGVVPLIFAIWAIVRFWRDKFVKFATFTSAFFILSALPGPLTYLIKTSHLPILDSTTPSRFVSISILLLIILAAKGFEDFIRNFKENDYSRSFLKFLIPLGLIYLALWTFAIAGTLFLAPQDAWKIKLAVTRRNLILPTAMFLSIPIGVLIMGIIRVKIRANDKLLRGLLITGIFIVTLIGAVYYSNKFLPVAPKKFIFPDHLLFKWLQDNAGIYRFHGSGTAHIDFNFPTHYQVFGAEGYDTLRLKRYAELLASSFTGSVPATYLRSDGVFPNEENGKRRRLFELLGVKYLLDKEDNPRTGADWHYERFTGDDVKGIWQMDKFQVYERQPVLPRIFLTNKYYIAKNDEDIITKIYDSNFNLKSLVLEKEPEIKIADVTPEITIPQLIKYEANQIVVKTNLPHNSLLYLSDAHDPDWNVTIDNRKRELLRAHYALRAVAVPSGDHLVVFKYQPKSFYQGVIISISSAIGLLVSSLYFVMKKKF